jgi:hypothetical protein
LDEGVVTIFPAILLLHFKANTRITVLRFAFAVWRCFGLLFAIDKEQTCSI